MTVGDATGTGAGRRIALAALLLGTFMGVLDTFVVTVALPAIRADLRANFGQTQLILAGYALAYAVGLITGGRLGDVYGRRRMFMPGMAAFVAASVACGIAQNPIVLIAGRIIQGLAAAAVLPQVLSTIRAVFPDEERRTAVGWYGTVVGLGAVAGPVIGGLLVGIDLGGFGWRLVFLINVPVGLVAMVGAALTVPESHAVGAAGLDLVGVGLSGAGLAAALLALTQGIETSWSPWTFWLLAAAPLLLGGFVAHERRLARTAAADPLLPLRLFAHRGFAGGIGVVLLLYAGDALFFVLTSYFQEGLRLSPAQTGLLLAPVGLGFALASAVAARLVARRGLLVPATGIALNTAGLVGVAVVDATRTAAERPPWFALVLLIVGMGHGLAINPIINLVVSAVAPHDAGVASGVLLTTTQVANALGVAVAGSLFVGLLTRGPGPHGTAEFSRALVWAMVLLAALTVAALPLLRRLRDEVEPVHPT